MIPLPATLFLGYALLGGALFLFSSGMRGFFQESGASLSVHSLPGRRHGANLAQAIVSLVLATFLLLGATIALMTVAARLL
jgi:hypothetical protein